MKIRWLFRILAIVFVLVVLAALFDPYIFEESWEFLHPYKADWTEHGLDPNAPNFVPEVLFIAGEVKANQTHFRPYEGNRYFEITMCGRNQYFRKEWVGRQGKIGSWWNVELNLGGFRGHKGIRYGRFGSGGGGGMNDWTDVPTNEIPLCVGQNLWEDSGFVGATAEDQTSKDRWSQTEVFQNMEQRGQYKIPRKILFSINHGTYYGGYQTATYIVKRIEFRKAPSTNWFREMEQKYFPSAIEREKEGRHNTQTNIQTVQ
jgi:hypothetical protein